MPEPFCLVVLKEQMSNPSPTLVAVLRAYEDLESCPISPDPAPRVELKTSRRLTDTETELAVALYEAGMNVDEVANQFGVHRHTMSTRLKAAGVQLRFAALTRKQISEAIKLYQEGWSIARVGEHIGKDSSAIWRTLKQAGVPRRDSHGRMK